MCCLLHRQHVVCPSLPLRALAGSALLFEGRLDALSKRDAAGRRELRALENCPAFYLRLLTSHVVHLCQLALLQQQQHVGKEASFHPSPSCSLLLLRILPSCCQEQCVPRLSCLEETIFFFNSCTAGASLASRPDSSASSPCPAVAAACLPPAVPLVSIEAMGSSSNQGRACRLGTLSVNRWVLFVVLCLYCLLAGPAYFNWTPMADTLLEHGAFLWECSEAEVKSANAQSFQPKCAAQDLAIGRLFNIASSSHFFCSFLGGIFLDSLGPKVAGMLGVGAMLIGWVLVALSSQSFAAYSFAAFLIGFSVDTAFFPCLSVANLFPGRESTIISFFGCFRSLSFVVPLAVRAAVVDTNTATAPQALLVYAGLFLALCFVAVALLMPQAPFERRAEQAPQESLKDPQQPSTQVGATPALTGEDSCVDHTASGSGPRRSLKERLCERLRLKELFADACSLAYLPLIPMYCFLLTNVIFFVPSTMHLLPSAYKANQIIQTLSFLPCPVLGLVADTLGILPVMQFTNLCGLLAYLCTIIPSIPAPPALQYVASVCFAVQVCFVMSQLYCYLAQAVSPRNLGTLVGLVCACGGLFSLVTSPMRSHALKHGFLSMCIVGVTLFCANACLLVLLHFVSERRKARASKQAVVPLDAQQTAV
ncbi:hypothetical protein Esti_001448 [Eimeria stiedai]